MKVEEIQSYLFNGCEDLHLTISKTSKYHHLRRKKTAAGTYVLGFEYCQMVVLGE